VAAQSVRLSAWNSRTVRLIAPDHEASGSVVKSECCATLAPSSLARVPGRTQRKRRHAFPPLHQTSSGASSRDSLEPEIKAQVVKEAAKQGISERSARQALVDAEPKRKRETTAVRLTDQKSQRGSARVMPTRRHDEVVKAVTHVVRLAERWDRSMTDSLTPPQAKKQLTQLGKASDFLEEVIEAVEYRSASLT
jgi:hypothetical protein